MLMRCEEVDSLIEPLAAGEVVPDAAVSSHLSECPRCRGALPLAQRLDAVLRAQKPAAPSSDFVARALRRIRRERWRSEQYLDFGFNLALAVGVALILGGFWLLLNISGMTAVTSDAARVLRDALGEFLARITPALPVYAAAAAVLATGLGVWWWVERDAW